MYAGGSYCYQTFCMLMQHPEEGWWWLILCPSWEWACSMGPHLVRVSQSLRLCVTLRADLHHAILHLKKCMDTLS